MRTLALLPSTTLSHFKATLVEIKLSQNYKTTVGSSHDMHSIIQSGLIPVEKYQEREFDGILHSSESYVHTSTQARIAVYK